MVQIKRVYCDYAASTPVDKRVLKTMLPFFDKVFANTGSLHSFGNEAKQALAHSRKVIADIIHAKAQEIIFTSSATEANNLALKGIAWANQKKGKHIIISGVEHSCVTVSAGWLQQQGFELTILPVDKYGMVSPAQVNKAIRPDTILVSVMTANNEVGTINPIAQIGQVCHKRGVIFHTDAVQAFGMLPIDVNRQHVDLLTASSHKIYGPKGVGCLYVRNGIKITPLIHGGGQEFGLRSSSVNVSGIVGFAQAAAILHKEAKQDKLRLLKLKNYLVANILRKIDNVELGGHPIKRLPQNAHFIFPDILGETLILALDKQGIAAATGAACLSYTTAYSHVLAACGKNKAQCQGALRISLGRYTTKADVDYIIQTLPRVVKKLRSLN